MKKNFVYVITINEVDGCCDYPHIPRVFSNREDAVEYLKNAYNQSVSEYGIGLEEDDTFVAEFSETCASIYEDGRYSENHWSITLDEVEIDANL